MTRTVLTADSPPAVRSTSRRLRIGTVVLAHPVVDAYSTFLPPLLGILQFRCDLTDWQTASLLSIGPLTSGISQPISAWLTDRIDSRLLAALGLAVAAAALSCIGLARDFTTLVILYSVGMFGVGAFHPVAAASIGQLSGRRRSGGVTLFFVAGMIGAAAGPIISTRMTAIEGNGFDLLRWAMIPGLIAAVVLHLAIRDVPHRSHEHRTMRFEPAEVHRRWLATLLLCAGNAMRYSVNMALFYLYVRLAETLVAQHAPGLERSVIAGRGALYAGELVALTMLGMGAGGLMAGLLARRGREKPLLVWIPLLASPTIMLFPQANQLGGYVLAFVAGVGFAALIPLTISLSQRLLPHRTSLASSLVMGSAWTIASLAAPAAEWMRVRVDIGGSFVAVALLLALSGVAGTLVPGDLLARVGESDG